MNQLKEALKKIKESYDAFYIENKYGSDNTHKKEFDLLEAKLTKELDQHALSWIKHCYDCSYKNEMDDNSPFAHLEKRIAEDEKLEEQNAKPIKTAKPKSWETKLRTKCAALSPEKLIDLYWESLNEIIGSPVEKMIERDYDPRDIKDRREYEKHCEDETRIIEEVAKERGIKLL